MNEQQPNVIGNVFSETPDDVHDEHVVGMTVSLSGDAQGSAAEHVALDVVCISLDAAISKLVGQRCGRAKAVLVVAITLRDSRGMNRLQALPSMTARWGV